MKSDCSRFSNCLVREGCRVSSTGSIIYMLVCIKNELYRLRVVGVVDSCNCLPLMNVSNVVCGKTVLNQ